MGNLKEIIETYPDEAFLIADGFDDAVIGWEEKSCRLIYSISKCIDILKEDMSEDEALEYFYRNVEGAYVGEKTPIWCLDYL